MSVPSSLSPGDIRWLRLTGGLVMGIALLVITGWVTNRPTLTSFYPGVPGAVMNSGLCGLLCGLAMVSLSREWRMLAAFCSVVVMGLAGITYCQHWFGVDFGVDDLFWVHPARPFDLYPGRMRPAGSGSYVLLGMALLLYARQGPRSWLLPFLATAIGAFACLPLLHYGILWLVSPEAETYWDVALPTVATLLLLAAALVRRPSGTGPGVSESIRLLGIGFGVIAAVWVFWWLRQDMLKRAEEAVQRSRELRSGVGDLTVGFVQLEAAVRSHLNTGGASALALYQENRQVITAQLAALPVLQDSLDPRMADSSEQQQRLERLTTLVQEKVARAAYWITRRQAGELSAAEKKTAMEQTTMRLVTKLIGEISAAELQQLKARESWYRARSRSAGAVQGLGNGVGLLFMFLAVWRAVRVERALAEANRAEVAARRRLETTFGTISEGLVMQDVARGIIEVNAAAGRILGLAPDQLLGRSSLDPRWRAVNENGEVYPGEAHPAMITLRTGQPQRGVVMGIDRPDGSRVWVSVNSEPVRGPDGAMQAVVMSFADITLRREREAALKASEERFALAVRGSSDGLWDWRIDADEVYYSERFKELLGYAGLEFTTKRLLHTELLHPEDRSRLSAATEAHLERREPFAIEYRLRVRSGEYRWFFARGQAVWDAAGRPRRMAGSLTDITERKQLEYSLALSRDEALAASRLKSEFLATISHEIRTPMNAVVGMTGLLMETLEQPAQREMAQVIQTGADNLLAIINDILDLSKIEAGKLRIEPEAFALRALVEECLTLLALRAQVKNVELLCEYDPELRSGLIGDAGRLRQVLINLIGNAIKFTEQGEVCVVVRQIEEGSGRLIFRIEVRDTGIGIPLAAQRRLFQPFVQADGSTTRRFGGTGLGLAITRQLVELMGGEIGFASAEGTGSTFWCQLTMPTQPPASLLTPALPPGKRVLVVDDNQTSRKIMLDLLGELGVPGEAVAGAPEAMLALHQALQQQQPFAAALLDWRMPGQDGAELAVAIRNDPALTSLPLVLLATAPGLTEEVARLHFQAVLNKPVRVAALHRVLEQIWRRDPAGSSQESAPVMNGDESGPASGLKLLLAEDNSTNQIVARRLLEKLGHQVEVVENGEAAVQRLAAHSYDAVLMDCQMPLMDGYSATQKIRAQEQALGRGRCPIIALTAYAMPSDRLKCFAAGMDDYVAKPLRLADLQQAFLRMGLGAKATLEKKPQREPVASKAVTVLREEQLAVLRDLPGRKHPTLLQEVAELLLAEAPAALSRLQQGLAACDQSETVAVAHRLAGSAANLGADELRAAALAVENAAREGDWRKVAEAWTVLDQSWRGVSVALRKLLTTDVT